MFKRGMSGKLKPSNMHACLIAPMSAKHIAGLALPVSFACAFIRGCAFSVLASLVASGLVAQLSLRMQVRSAGRGMGALSSPSC